jgi:hypothetical protein
MTCTHRDGGDPAPSMQQLSSVPWPTPVVLQRIATIARGGCLAATYPTREV